LTVQKALPLMGAGSAIVVTGSIAARQGTPAFSLYAATMAALRSFVRGWASDLKGRDIRVNIVAPGVVVTPACSSNISDGLAGSMSVMTGDGPSPCCACVRWMQVNSRLCSSRRHAPTMTLSSIGDVRGHSSV
jgi:NAD(P)-dependent dehydrogenase (short-subunit alcohol dehydrogenase family)